MEVPPGEVPERMKVPGRPSRPVAAGGPSSGGSSQWSPAGGQPLAGASAPADNSPVAQITLHPALTGGIGTGGRPGDEGLLVVVEPRDFGGNIVNAPGNISVALLDPALTGEQAGWRVGILPRRRPKGMIRTGSQPGIHLRLPWISTPAHDRLKVFVRYTTRDGRKLQAERLIGVALNGPPPARPRGPPGCRARADCLRRAAMVAGEIGYLLLSENPIFGERPTRRMTNSGFACIQGSPIF